VSRPAHESSSRPPFGPPHRGWVGQVDCRRGRQSQEVTKKALFCNLRQGPVENAAAGMSDQDLAEGGLRGHEFAQHGLDPAPDDGEANSGAEEPDLLEEAGVCTFTESPAKGPLALYKLAERPADAKLWWIAQKVCQDKRRRAPCQVAARRVPPRSNRTDADVRARVGNGREGRIFLSLPGVKLQLPACV
jgi:hypothetical protein